MQTKLDKLVIGTAQFGDSYGIANQTGQPSKKEVFDILSLAWDHGVRRYDTAPTYGSSESLLGEFIRAHGVAEEILISTKIPQLYDRDRFKNEISYSISKSLSRLKSSIDVLFFHKAKDSLVVLRDWEYFTRLMKSEPINRIGVSVYEKSEVADLGDYAKKLAFQFPFNLVDRQFVSLIGMTGARYARSIFLQGVLANKIYIQQSAPIQLREFHHRYHSFLERSKVDPIELAMSFVIHSAAIDYAIIGVERIAQIRELIEIQVMDSDYVSSVAQLIPKLKEKFRDPRYW